MMPRLPKKNVGRAARVAGTVDHDDEVGSHLRRMRHHHLFEHRRARFFIAFEDQADRGGRRGP
jgi:hypothetical protein